MAKMSNQPRKTSRSKKTKKRLAAKHVKLALKKAKKNKRHVKIAKK